MLDIIIILNQYVMHQISVHLHELCQWLSVQGRIQDSQKGGAQIYIVVNMIIV